MFLYVQICIVESSKSSPFVTEYGVSGTTYAPEGIIFDKAGVQVRFSFFLSFSYLGIHAETKHIPFETKWLANNNIMRVQFFQSRGLNFLIKDPIEDLECYICCVYPFVAGIPTAWFWKYFCTIKDWIKLSPFCDVSLQSMNL